MTETKITNPDDAPKSYDHEKTILHNRVPEVTFLFWVIKILSTTTGETFADYLNEEIGLGLPNTTYIMLSLLIVAMAAQLYTSRYNSFVYWLVVVLISVVGTLVTDNLTDGVGVPLWVSTIVFSVLLAVTFTGWYWKERTLSFHCIFTRRREAFYWVAVLFTFALGTAVGDLITEGWGLGYWQGLLLFAGIIAVDFVAWYFFKLNAVFSFWVAYVLTRPLGASLGDLLGADKEEGGWGIGTNVTSIVFLCIILVCVSYLQYAIHRERKELEVEKASPGTSQLTGKKNMANQQETYYEDNYEDNV